MYTRNVKENIMQWINLWCKFHLTSHSTHAVVLCFLPGDGVCDLNCTKWMKGWELGLWTKSILTVEARWPQNTVTHCLTGQSATVKDWPARTKKHLSVCERNEVCEVCISCTQDWSGLLTSICIVVVCQWDI